LNKAQAVVQKNIKKECNVNCFEFFFFSVFLTDVMGGKITISLQELHQNRKIKKHMDTGKELEEL